MVFVAGDAPAPPIIERLLDRLDAAGVRDDSDAIRVVWLGAATEVDRLGGVAGHTLVLTEPAHARRGPSVWELLDAGAEAVLTWTGEDCLDDIVARCARWHAVDTALASPRVARRILGRSQALVGALREVIELAVFGNGPIVLVGETGTGKELAARLVHDVAKRHAKGEFVVVDCTTIVPSLSGSELFGHERGAFTGADRARAGAFSTADRGTLFLDEIGELSLGLQAELLRVLQEGTYKRVGGDTWSRTSFRLVSATNRDLAAEQAEGRFRADLYHRIASGVVRMPTLSERTEDVPLLFEHFVREALGRPDATVSAEVQWMLRERSFPGNLRELRQLAFAVAARHAGDGPIAPGDVPARHRPDGSPQPIDTESTLEEAVRRCLADGMTLAEMKSLIGDLAVTVALDDAGGNVHRAATALGVTDRAVQLRRQAPRGGDAQRLASSSKASSRRKSAVS